MMQTFFFGDSEGKPSEPGRFSTSTPLKNPPLHQQINPLLTQPKSFPGSGTQAVCAGLRPGLT